MNSQTVFFCGVGGSGMSALAQYLCRCGCLVMGSDRSFDQGHNAEVRTALRTDGITVVPQDGSGVTPRVNRLVVSTAIEPTIPDVTAAKNLAIPIVTRAELLAEVFHSFATRVAVGGTSGKSTVTAMVAHILAECGQDPTVINGAPMADGLCDPGIGNLRLGSQDLCVIEADESDGSIANYAPTVSVLTNLGHDHKSLPELRELFGAFLRKADGGTVLNADCAESMALPRPNRTMTFGIRDHVADFCPTNIRPKDGGMVYCLHGKKHVLPVPGLHNVGNAMAAVAAAHLLGLPDDTSAAALQTFGGVRRRLETIGTSHGITVIDDFAHNPDKVRASLEALKETSGRLRVVFQPHGFAPLQSFLEPLADAFASGLASADVLIVAPVYYAGGTVTRMVTSEDLAAAVNARGAKAQPCSDRADVISLLCESCLPGDRIVVMGARDDTLTDFCRNILAKLDRGIGKDGGTV